MKRPIVRYTEVLNGISDVEWEQLQLPDPTSVCQKANCQLPDILAPVDAAHLVLPGDQGSRLAPEPDTVGQGVASDHSVPIVRPNVDPSSRTGFSRTEVRTRRVVATSGLVMFGLFIACFDW